MSFDWNLLLQRNAADTDEVDAIAAGYPASFGAPGDELATAAAGEAIVSPLADRSWLSCSGADARQFLHNQLTSDVNHLAPGAWQHSSWCSAKGRMLASFLLAHAETPGADTTPVYHLQLAAGLREVIAKRLRMFVLRSQVTIVAADDLVSLGLSASEADAGRVLAAAGLPCPANVGAGVPFAGGWVMRVKGTLYQLAIKADLAATTFASLARTARPVGVSTWQWLEVQAGLPMVTAETQDEFVPQMVNFDKCQAVSFSKGCYPGQEVIARTQYLGKVKRHLYKIHASVPLFPGMPLKAIEADGDHAVGVVANAAPSPASGYDALAVILETSAASPVFPSDTTAPPLSSLDLVTA